VTQSLIGKMDAPKTWPDDGQPPSCEPVQSPQPAVLASAKVGNLTVLSWTVNGPEAEFVFFFTKSGFAL
jgi:hypothetical protein